MYDSQKGRKERRRRKGGIDGTKHIGLCQAPKQIHIYTMTRSLIKNKIKLSYMKKPLSIELPKRNILI